MPAFFSYAKLFTYTKFTDYPLIFLEPSCLSAFLDDYPARVGETLKTSAHQLAQRCITAEDWLVQNWEDSRITWKQNPSEILLHGHCHQKA